jgi:hypothetical protein
MKRVLASIFTILYLSTSLGASLHFHYCMGKLVSWGLISRESANCSFCGMPKNISPSKNQVGKNNCCKDDHKEIRTAGDQKSAQNENQVQKDSPVDAAVYSHSFQPEHFSSGSPFQILTHGPPLSASQPSYLLNCNFRI